MSVSGIGRVVLHVDGNEVDRYCLRADDAPERLVELSRTYQVSYSAPEVPVDGDNVLQLTFGPEP